MRKASKSFDEIVFVVEADSESGGFVASCQRYGVFTQGDSIDELKTMVKDAVAARFEGVKKKPARIRLHLIRDEVIPA